MPASTTSQQTAPRVELEPQSKEARRVIDVSFRSIRRIRSLINSHAPISRLPAELMARIFILYQEEPVEAFNLPPNSLYWIGITHVCRQWRDIALNSAELWTEIPFEYPEWASEMLLRSKMADLVVRVDLRSDAYQIEEGTKSESFELLKTFFQTHLSRARRITFRYVSNLEQLRSLLCPLKPTPVPRLQVLEVLAPSLFGLGDDEFDIVGELGRVLTDTVNLRELKIYFASRWETTLFTGLTHLTIFNGFAPEPHEFLKGLSQMSSLQFLRLENMLPHPQGLEAHSSLNIPNASLNLLSNLTTLILSSTAPQILWFLENVPIPATARLDLSCHSLEVDEYVQVASRLAMRFNAIPATANGHRRLGDERNFTAVHMVLDEDVLILRLWEESKTVEGLDAAYPALPNDLAPISLTFEWRWDGPDFRENVLQAAYGAWNVLPCHDLQVLSVDLHVAVIEAEDFFWVIGAQHNLESLYLESIMAFFIIETLSASAREVMHADNPGNAVIRLPALRSLNIEHIPLEGKYSVEFFEKFLFRRRKAGCEIMRLHFQDAVNRTQEDPYTLQNFVRDFSWDGST